MSYIVDRSYTALNTAPRASLITRLKARLATRKQHQQLKALTNEQLQDIGLTRCDVNTEISRNMWAI
ncbi:MAG: hypothetical protein COB84_04970 [Rhodobacteraceae bacterium]|nr:MAG: hypothetical protein COB84_04970 [Paracoccaceae bacterium]